MSGGGERVALHRIFILLTLAIFVFNLKSVISGFSKNKLITLLILYVLATAFWSSNTTETIKNFVFLMSSLSISIMTALAFQGDHKKLVRILFWFCLVMVSASIVTALKFPQYGINSRDFSKSRWIGITDHPNKLGGLVVLSIWSSINLFYLTQSKLEKLIVIFSIILASYAVVNADSMTSIVASLVIICYTSYLHLISHRSISLKITLCFVALLTSLIVTTFYMSSEEIVTETLATSGRNTTLTGRSLLWKIGLDSFSKNILLGLGFDDLEGLTKKNHITMSHLHNGYLEVLVKGGVVAGFLVLVVIIMTLLKHMAMKKTQSDVFIFFSTGLVSVLVHNLAESSILRGLNGLGLIFILIVAYTNISYKHVRLIEPL